MAQVQTRQGLLHCLVTGEASPFMVASGGADFSQLQIGLRLMQPIGGTVLHGAVVAAMAVEPRRSAQRQLSAAVPATVSIGRGLLRHRIY